jgi:hypothetical protein
MRKFTKGFAVFLLAFVLGTLYAIFIGMTSKLLMAPLIAWPIWVGLFWLLFGKFKLARYAGFIAVLPVTFIGFEMLWSSSHPGMNAEKYKTFDRSHYTPGFRVRNPQVNVTDPNARGWQLKEILIGKDGFRADPETGQGNPERCQFVLIGDSMIYGTGLPYPVTLGPVLASMGVKACIFGVTGNSPVDYFATLKYAADRIDPGAQVVFYLYAYNDFVSLDKYFTRGFLSLSNWFPRLFEWVSYFDTWRQATLTYAIVRGQQASRPLKPWQYDVGKGEPIKILYAHDPAKYVRPKPLNKQQLAALNFFFKGLEDFAHGRSWRISIVIHPDDSEIYANFAKRSPALEELDPRRAGGLKACKKFAFVCDDMSRYLYEGSMAAGKNPYFSNNRHFSRFGTRMVAEHFVALTKRVSEGITKPAKEPM